MPFNRISVSNETLIIIEVYSSKQSHQILNCRGKLHILLKGHGQVEEAFDTVPGTLPGPLSVSKAHLHLGGHDNISQPCSPSEIDLLTKLVNAEDTAATDEQTSRSDDMPHCVF